MAERNFLRAGNLEKDGTTYLNATLGEFRGAKNIGRKRKEVEETMGKRLHAEWVRSPWVYASFYSFLEH